VLMYRNILFLVKVASNKESLRKVFNNNQE